MKVFSAIILSMAIIAGCSDSSVRNPAVAGTFYPADKIELSKMIDGFLSNAEQKNTEKDLIALIVPHAGYVYSGQVAAYGFKQLANRRFKRVIIIGTSHKTTFEGAVLTDYDYFETPLGKIKVDKDFNKKLIDSNKQITANNNVHDGEHCLEVELPFLQKTLNGFKIVPILFGSTNANNCIMLLNSLSSLIDKDTLIVASTDLSHYYKYDTANILDKTGLDLIEQNDFQKYFDMIAEGKTEACGSSAVVTTMMIASQLGANRGQILNHANSGDTSGDKTRVVGYGSIAFYKDGFSLSESDKKEMRSLATNTLQQILKGNKIAEYKPVSEGLKQKAGVFVTLYKHSQLRGCIGLIQGSEPLYIGIPKMARAAALEDTRFSPVTYDELKDIETEISVLTPLKQVNSYEDIVVGRDGTYIMKDNRSAIFLPQVAPEQGWDRDTMLQHLCLKAELTIDAWKSKDMKFFTYQAIVF